MTARLTTITLAAGVLIPLAVAAIFIMRFAIAAPLTDEWLLVHNAMTLHDAPPGLEGLFAAFGQMRWLCYTHPVIIPNLIYLAVAPLIHFDARPFLFVTLAGNALILCCGYLRGLRGVALVVAAILVFSPARYMEMMWGFQFAFGLSVALGAAGLALLDAAGSAKNGTRFAIGGFATIGLGMLCSAPAAFALPAAAFTYLVTRGYAGKLALVVGLSCLVVLVELLFFFPPLQIAAGLVRTLLFILTAIGALALSSPVGLFSFTLDARAIAGAVIVALDAVIIIGAFRRGTARELAFGIAMVAYGLLAMLSIALFRPALGNWHLQCAVPLAVGTLWLVGRDLPQASTLRKAALIVIPLTALIGYVNAFRTLGPEYRVYAESVRSYMIDSVTNPQLEKPYPVPYAWDTTPALARFLHDAGNPDFAGLKTGD